LKATSAGAAVLVSHMSTGRLPALAALRAAAATGRPVFYAGNTFRPASPRRGVTGRYLVERLTAAADIIDASRNR
jgi:hypothetical protein